MSVFLFLLLSILLFEVNNINQSDSTVIKLTCYYAMKSLALYVFIYFSIDLVPKYWYFVTSLQRNISSKAS